MNNLINPRPKRIRRATVNFLDDVWYCDNYGRATRWYERLALEQPLLAITSPVMYKLMRKAITLLAASGCNILFVWSLEDLFQEKNFKAVLREDGTHLPPYEATQLEFLLLAIARDWVGLDADELGKLAALAPPLPKPQRVQVRARQSHVFHVNGQRGRGVVTPTKAVAAHESNGGKA